MAYAAREPSGYQELCVVIVSVAEGGGYRLLSLLVGGFVAVAGWLPDGSLVDVAQTFGL